MHKCMNRCCQRQQFGRTGMLEQGQIVLIHHTCTDDRRMPIWQQRQGRKKCRRCVPKQHTSNTAPQDNHLLQWSRSGNQQHLWRSWSSLPAYFYRKQHRLEWGQSLRETNMYKMQSNKNGVQLKAPVKSDFYKALGTHTHQCGTGKTDRDHKQIIKGSHNNHLHTTG